MKQKVRIRNIKFVGNKEQRNKHCLLSGQRLLGIAVSWQHRTLDQKKHYWQDRKNKK